jgi:hypothetical protein
MGVPANMCGIDRDQTIQQAQREAADAALSKVGLEHRHAERHVATPDGAKL